MKDYYAILEVPPDATSDQIRDQYRFMIQAWHPDKFANPAQKDRAATKARDINEAYETLSNLARRANYDQRRQQEVASAQRALEQQRIQTDQAAEYARLYAVQERQLRQQAEQAAKDAAQKAEDERRRRRQAEHESHQARQLVSAAQKLFIVVLAVIVVLVFTGLLALLWYLGRAWLGL